MHERERDGGGRKEGEAGKMCYVAQMIYYMMVISVNLSDTALTVGSKPLGSPLVKQGRYQQQILLRNCS